MTEERARRKLSGILSADAVGYSRLMQEDEASTIRTLEENKGLMSKLIKQFKGRVVDAPGDNLLAEFASVVDATECAVKIQQDLKAKNLELPDNRRMEFRIGVNLGDVVEKSDRIYGDGVNIAARIEGIAKPGGICISRTAYDQVKNKLEVGYEYLGEHTVKNIAEPVRVYRVLMEPEAAGKVIGEKWFLGRISRKAAIAAIIVLAIVAGGLISWNIYLQQFKKVEPASLEKMAYPLPDRPSIVVLPFDNLKDDPEQSYLADGLTENIIATLSKIPEMFVIARNSSFTYKGKAVKVQEVAQDLGVRYVLEGSVQRSGDRLRIIAQLIDALRGYHLWSERYNRKMKDLFDVQDDIALKIAVAMQVKLTEGEQALIRHSTNNLEAWSLAVKAHDIFENYTKNDNMRARELFKQAVELDPEYDYAWTYLGFTYLVDARFFGVEESYERTLEMASKALSINKNSSEAHALLGTLHLAQRKYDEAVVAGKRSIVLGHSVSENYAFLAITMQAVGDGEAMISLIKQAMRLDPYFPPWYWFRLGIGYRLIGQYEESVKCLKKRIEIAEKANKPLHGHYLELATTYSMMDRLEEAKNFTKKALQINSKVSIEWWCERQPYKDSWHTERIREALRKTGLK